MANIVDFQNFFIFLLVSIFSLICYSLFFKKPKVSYDLPPSPPSLPIIGHLHHLLSPRIHKSLQKLNSKYGSILYLRVFSLHLLVVSSASITSDIFKAQDINLSTRDLFLNEGSLFFGSFGFVTSPYGDYWKFIKKLIVAKLLGPQALERSRSFRADEVKRFYSNLLDKARKKETVELVEEVMKLTNNIICKMIIGTSFPEEDSEGKRLRGLLSESGALLIKIFLSSILRKPLARFGISLFKKELMGNSHKIDKVFEKILIDFEEKQDEHIHQGSDIMDALLDASKNENVEYKITRNHIKSLLMVNTL